MKTKCVQWALLIAVISSFSSCMTTQTPVGQYLSTQGETYTYDKGKQFWLFWGVIPLGRTHVNTPADGNCMVITKKKFGDVIISTITAGIIMTHSIKVEAKKKPQTATPETAPK